MFTVDQEYFSVTKVMWAKYLMSFNFVNFAEIYTKFIQLWIFYYTKFFRVMCTCIVIEMAVYSIQRTWLPCLYRLIGCIDLRRYFDHDWYAVAVVKGDTVVGHIPRKISWICSLFLAKGGAITCTLIEGRIYFSHLQLLYSL